LCVIVGHRKLVRIISVRYGFLMAGSVVVNDG